MEIAPQVSHIRYKEPQVMEEKGVMYGIGGSYAYHNKVMLKIQAGYSLGQLDYKNSGTIDNIDNYMIELRGLGGYDIPVSKATVLTPYIGLGYRYLNDDSSGKISSTGAYGYERESTYYYSPIGIESVTQLNSAWSVGLTVEYDLFWEGKQKSHLSDVNASFSDLKNDQHQGYGWRGSVSLRKKGKKVSFVMEPFVKYWNIAKSERSFITVSGSIWGYGWEPENNSTEFGIKLAAIF
ncbi:MAG: autotransporter outer membrane beta-barrel domain-containing protein [Deferribacteres bacterium]|nr:autotransporter outer membrane beta-barrel domain-containing protein [Deferribacteres bacterium]